MATALPYLGPERRSYQSQSIRAAVRAALDEHSNGNGKRKTVAAVGIPVIAVLGFMWNRIDKMEDRERGSIVQAATEQSQHAQILEAIRELRREAKDQREYMYWRLGPPPAGIGSKLGMEKEGE